MEGTLRWLQDEAVANKLTVDATWEMIDVPHREQPNQTDKPLRDCAIFACLNADLIADDIPITQFVYTQADIDNYGLRRKIGCDILRGHLNYPMFN